jgi:hypothetical protein
MSSKHQSRTFAAPADFPFPAFSPSMSDSPAMLAVRLQAGAYRSMLKWQIEQMNFLRHRYEQDLRFIDDLVGSPEPGEMLGATSCFLQNALDDYSREAVKAATLSGRLVTDAARDLRLEAEKISDNAKAATVG